MAAQAAGTPRRALWRSLRGARLLVGASAALIVAAAPGSPPSAAAVSASPNGLIAYASSSHEFEVYIADKNGSGVRRLTTDAAGSRWPAISPDGTRVAFTRKLNAGWGIFVEGVDGSHPINIAAATGSTDGFSGYPDWSPDGTHIVFSHLYPGSGVGLVVYDVATGVATNITPDKWMNLWPRWSPDGTKIAFASNRVGGNFNVYSIQADGTGLTQLTSEAWWEIEPSWSPDGTRIAYVAFPGDGELGDIFVMNADGSGARDITNLPQSDEEEPAWSPSGLLIRSDRTGVPQLYAIHPDGTGLRPVTSGTLENSDPSWSHDGSHLVFASSRNVVSKIATTAAKVLTHGPGLDSEPSWSPDGAHIAFVRSRRTLSAQDIYVMNANGGGLRNLTHGRGINWAPVWSPDGKSIAFVRFESFGAQIWLMRADGTHQEALTSLGNWNDHPSWSPDGRRLVYSARRNGNYDLYILDLKTRREQRLTRDVRAEVQPAWSPDGALIAFVAFVPGTADTEIYVISPNGGRVRGLTHPDFTSSSDPAWSPDSSLIVYDHVNFVGHDTDLYVVDRAGNTNSPLVTFAWSEVTPAWQRVP